MYKAYCAHPSPTYPVACSGLIALYPYTPTRTRTPTPIPLTLTLTLTQPLTPTPTPTPIPLPLPGGVLGRVAREGLQVAGGLRALCGQRQPLWVESRRSRHSAARWNRTRDAVVAAHWMNDAPSRGRGPLVWCAPAPLSAFCVAAPAAHCVAPRERLLVYSAPSAVVFCVDFALEFIRE